MTTSNKLSPYTEVACLVAFLVYKSISRYIIEIEDILRKYCNHTSNIQHFQVCIRFESFHKYRAVPGTIFFTDLYKLCEFIYSYIQCIWPNDAFFFIQKYWRLFRQTSNRALALSFVVADKRKIFILWRLTFNTITQTHFTNASDEVVNN